MVKVGVYDLLIACCLIAQASNASRNLPERWFRCNDGRYIPSRFFCDGSRNCPDNEDEGMGCDSGEELLFTCPIIDVGDDYGDMTEMFSVDVICNTIKECKDGSDEANCGNQLNVSNCSLSDGNFLCHDNKRCLDFRYTCDGYCNCFDCSDENENCTALDFALEQKCVRGYIRTPNGPICLCDEPNNTRFSSMCDSIENCEAIESILKCEQKCFKFKNRPFCACNEGYHSIYAGEGHKCRSNSWLEYTLLYSTLSDIQSLNLTTNLTTTIQTDVNCTALTAAGDYVYYATSENFIFKTPMNSSWAESEKLIKSASSVDSMAVDYITGNIYYVANYSLFVCNGSGQGCIQLKCCNIVNVALAPKFGYMFYTKNWARRNAKGALPRYHIMKANMDGSSEAVFVADISDSTTYTYPIAVNELERKILFFSKPSSCNVTACAALEYTPFDVKLTRFDQVSSTEGEWDPLSVAFVDDIVFHTRKQLENVIYMGSFGEYTGSTFHYELDPNNDFLDNTTKTVKYLWAHNYLVQLSTQNPCAVASCPGLCLLRPTTSAVNSTLTYTCYQNTTSQSDNTRWYVIQTANPKQNTHNRDRFAPIKEESYSSAAEHPKSAELPQSTERLLNRNILAIVSVLLFLAIVLGFGGYFTFKKLNGCRYSGNLRSLKWNRHTERVEVLRDEGM